MSRCVRGYSWSSRKQRVRGKVTAVLERRPRHHGLSPRSAATGKQTCRRRGDATARPQPREVWSAGSLSCTDVVGASQCPTAGSGNP